MNEDPFDFDILEIGCTGTTEVIINPTKSSTGLKHLTTLPCGLPSSFKSEEKHALQQYLVHPGKLAIHDFHRTQRFWARERDPGSLLTAEPCPIQTSVRVDRNPKTGELLGFKEVSVPNTDATTKNSMSLSRQPGALADPVKGTSTSFPFLPGGMDKIQSKVQDLAFDGDLNFEEGLLDTPPMFKHPVTFGANGNKEQKNVFQVMSVTDVQSFTVLEDLDIYHSDDDEEEDDLSAAKAATEENEKDPALEHLGLDIPVKDEPEVSTETETQPAVQEKWAVMMDVSKPVVDFHKKVPHMAHKWDFEPDTFQKQAILKLETHESVFVAAHTSAGKTAVAEYAIALANRHKTKTIYTSPIKALSNQKFRDFKKNLVPAHPELDVGLITGDVQIKPEAACLIMTTEILRSMLYNGSDVIRDVEWVIFDEVHYINDAERGVVWEEVLIMLPDHVSIILLSATVPNTMEFADWIGRTKRKQIYVISTPKRPVPLEHFLYTGNSNSTSSEMFLLLDQNSTFLTRGYQKAVDAIKERSSKNKDMTGAKGAGKHFAKLKSERNVWLSLITMLEKKDKLPVVVFTFSRKKCDDNAEQLSNLNLTTSLEKSKTQVLLKKYLAKLKGTDRLLPQVKRMQEHLKRGIGVHHSGVLPILKEVIEILFQEGLVKLLFATETFAMGVNMPARTVVFDSIRKHDGSSFRNLLSGEYVQMAGRAGRRGLDTTGTVIVLCKAEVPEMSELHKMMLGKPISLNSQFRLTYSMIINLLRVEQLRVQEMMKRSFAEFNVHRDEAGLKREAEQLERTLSSLQNVDCLLCGEDLTGYYQTLAELHQLTHKVKAAILLSPFGHKALLPGRIVTLETSDHQKTLAVILQVESGSSGQTLIDKKVTVLYILEAGTDDKSFKSVSNSEDKQRLLTPYVASKLVLPEGPSTHTILTINTMDICDVTTHKVKAEYGRIIDDHKKRMLPRFRDDPPCRSALMVQQELLRLIEGNSTSGLETMDPVKDFNIRDLDMVDILTRKCHLEGIMGKFVCIGCPTFSDHFFKVQNEVILRDNLKQLQYLLSDESLHLIANYHQRIEVLRKLRYIDSSNRVQLKGRVACEMSNHELMVTELVFQNSLTDLHHTEIAALLSCFVFQQRRCSEPSLTKTLEQGKERILSIAGAIAAVQNECGLVTSEEDFKEQFYFGLVEVVYEWSRGVPFAEIINLTDVQEGIIVRCIQRLDETCRDVRNAAKIIGDPNLCKKMEEASTSIRRDIVFAASLYTQ